MILSTDANAHLHKEPVEDTAHAAQFRRILHHFALSHNSYDEPLKTFQSFSASWVQDDCIATSRDIHALPGSQEVVPFVRTAAGSYHEPVRSRVRIQPRPISMPGPRRIVEYDRNQLAYPAVRKKIIERLEGVHTPPKYVEQTSRAHVVGETLRGILADVAPIDAVQAFASIVAALNMPLTGREDAVRLVLKNNGFSDDDIDMAIQAGSFEKEWANTSNHMREHGGRPAIGWACGVYLALKRHQAYQPEARCFGAQYTV